MNYLLFYFFTCWFSLIRLCWSNSDYYLTLPVEGILQIPGGRFAGNIELTLNGGQFSALTRVDGSFTFHDIPTGVYILDASTVHYIFPQMKLKVASDEGTISVLEYKYPGAAKIPSQYPIILKALSSVNYFTPKPKFSILGMLMGNPMMIMMIISVGAMVLFPKMLQGMSPEELEEFKKQSSASGGDPMKELSKMIGVKSKNDDDDEDD